VTKYRKAMKIPSSRQRRDWKLARAAHPGGGSGPVEAEPVDAADDPDGDGTFDSLGGPEA
jgi:hypothetical protein